MIKAKSQKPEKLSEKKRRPVKSETPIMEMELPLSKIIAREQWAR